jgi:hypothetical protein
MRPTPEHLLPAPTGNLHHGLPLRVFVGSVGMSALMLGPIAATVATALAFVVYWIVVIEAH